MRAVRLELTGGDRRRVLAPGLKRGRPASREEGRRDEDGPGTKLGRRWRSHRDRCFRICLRARPPEPRPARKAGGGCGLLSREETRGPHLAAARGPDAAAAAAAMALSNPCPGARSSAAIPPTRAATRRSRAASARSAAVPGARREEGRARRRGRARREQGRARREAGRRGLLAPFSTQRRLPPLSQERSGKASPVNRRSFTPRAVALNRGKAALSLIFFFFAGIH